MLSLLLTYTRRYWWFERNDARYCWTKRYEF